MQFDSYLSEYFIDNDNANFLLYFILLLILIILSSRGSILYIFSIILFFSANRFSLSDPKPSTVYIIFNFRSKDLVCW